MKVRTKMSTTFVPPTPETEPSPSFSLAPRDFATLDGKVVGLLDSTKPNSDRLLLALGELLRERYAVKELVAAQKPYFGNPVPADQAAALAERCDVVITGVGD